MEVETLHSKAKEVCTKLVTVCRTLSQAVESRCPEEKLVDHIRTVAMSALNVSSTITSHVEARDQELREKAELQENFLADYDKSLRENIVSLVRHTRDFYANPLDYMTQQALNNCLKEVAVNVKSLVEAARGTFFPFPPFLALALHFTLSGSSRLHPLLLRFAASFAGADSAV